MIRRMLAARRERLRHDPQAYGCIYWTGDRRGVDLKAVCPVCGHEELA